MIMTTEHLRELTTTAAPNLSKSIDLLSIEWAKPILSALECLKGKRTGSPKTFADPVLGPIDLFEWEVLLLDSPFLQRLRGIKQLGMVHFVYPGAVHDRLAHSLGVVEIADRMINALSKNAKYRKEFGTGERTDEDLPVPDDSDKYTVRLAALLHDIGHGPFSHASEDLIRESQNGELEKLNDVFRGNFEGARGVKPSEALAVLLIVSQSLQKIFEHSRFSIPLQDKHELPLSLVALILGSKGGRLTAPYLYELISGPVDADKLDYMARDSYFTGLPLGIDVNRLIKKIEIVRITPDNAINAELRERASKTPNQAIYEMGVSLAGLTAYEQMIVGRALLYDRVYYHHKVRSGEAMVRKLFRVAQIERNAPYTVEELFTNVSDDAIIFVLSGKMQVEGMTGGLTGSNELASQIRNRLLFHRAFAFADRFFAGLEGIDKKERQDTRAALWNEIIESLSSEHSRKLIESAIVETANELLGALPSLPAESRKISEWDIIVDLPEDRVTVGNRVLPMRTEGGKITSANLFFNPDKWSEAYKSQKQCGFVFAKKGYKIVAWLASQIVFFNKFGTVMSDNAHHVCKTDAFLGEKLNKWLTDATDAGICSSECNLALSTERPRLLRLRVSDILCPDSWAQEDVEFKSRLAQGFFNALPGGLVASVHQNLISSLNGLCRILDSFYQGGKFKKDTRPDEAKDLQAAVLEHLRTAGIDAKEGVEVGGGESDILLPGDIILENKVVSETSDAMAEKIEASWQARRYSIAINKRISFVLLAYKPKSEAALLSMPASVTIETLENSPEPRATIRMCIPWGYGSPSGAKPPN
jgi:HD superfamily phosphohydrolase